MHGVKDTLSYKLLYVSLGATTVCRGVSAGVGAGGRRRSAEDRGGDGEGPRSLRLRQSRGTRVRHLVAYRPMSD